MPALRMEDRGKSIRRYLPQKGRDAALRALTSSRSSGVV
jgi:hypothetical protein